MKLKIINYLNLERGKFEVKMITFKRIILFLTFLHQYWCFSHMSVSAPHVCLVTSEVRIGWGNHLGLELQTNTNHCVYAGIESGSSKTVASVLWRQSHFSSYII